MDIEGASIIMARDRVMDAVSVAMLKKTMDGASSQAASLLTVLESAAPLPETSGKIFDAFA